MNFGSRLYLVLSTLSRSTSFGGWEAGSREEDERREGGREERIGKPYCGFLPASPLHDREHLAAMLSVPALLHSRVLALNPPSRQLTLQPDHVLYPNDSAAGGSQTFRVDGKLSIACYQSVAPKK